MFGIHQAEQRVRQHAGLGGNPLRGPGELPPDLLGRDEPRHSKTNFIPGTPDGEQVLANLIVCLAQNPHMLPGRTPDVAAGHMTDGLEVTDVQMERMRGRRPAPELLQRKIKSGETR